ncbi:unnamed protein product, partial [Coregonus sp. 'balchen']
HTNINRRRELLEKEKEEEELVVVVRRRRRGVKSGSSICSITRQDPCPAPPSSPSPSQGHTPPPSPRRPRCTMVDVYVFGLNCSNCLGLGDSQSTILPKKLDFTFLPLTISLSPGHRGPSCLPGATMATASWGTGPPTRGCVQCWCLPTCSTRGTSSYSVECNSLALLYAWGYNNCQVGSGFTANQPTPRRVSNCLQNKVAVSITCDVRLGNNGNQLTPCRLVGLQGLCVQQVSTHTYTTSSNIHPTPPLQIASGYAHSLQRATPHPPQQLRPIVARCTCGAIVVLFLTHFSCTDDFFACFTTPSVMWRLVSMGNRSIVCVFYFLTVAQSLKEEFDSPETANLKFSVDGKQAGLLDLATSYCENRLKCLCQCQHIKRGSPCATTQRSDLEEFCFKFCVNHLTDVTQTAAFWQIQGNLLKEFICRASRCGTLN